MTSEEQQLIMLRGTIAGLPDEQQIKIKALACLIREMVSQDKEIGTVALALVAAELSVQL